MYLLDTNIISYFVKGNKNVIKKITQIDLKNLFSSVLVYGECFAGLKTLELKNKYYPLYTRFFENIELLDFDFYSALEYVSQKQRLGNSGKIIETADTIIACTALANDLILVTNNTKHFERIEGLELQDWTLEE